MGSRLIRWACAAALCTVLLSPVSAHAQERPPVHSIVTIDELVKRYNVRIEDPISFADTPLPDAIRQVAERFGLPLVADNSLHDLSPMPRLNLTVSGITVRQLQDVMAACTWTSVWIDPPQPRLAHTPLRVMWMTKKRARELADRTTWKTVALDQSEKVLAALSQRVQLDFADTPLEDGLNFLREFHQIRVEYDGPPQLAKSLLTLQLEGQTLRVALDRMLTPLDLGYVVRGDTLRIATTEAAQRQVATRVYSLPALAGSEIDGRAVEGAILWEIGKGSPQMQTHVAWLGPCVSVTATELQHGLIEKFLAEFREADEAAARFGEMLRTPGQLPP